uniref:Ig-like domain-containing protein n=1 Tax=Neogobius melanostomus TaxID=47308 RepID=A0A8C6SX22_9GOBI
MLNKPNFAVIYKFVSFVVSTAQMNGLQERSRFLSLTVGDNITLRCNSIGNIGVGAKLHWYKQSLGRKPELVSSFLKYDKKSEFHGEFIRSNRVKLDNDNGKNDLYISDSIVSDSAVYHCVRCYLHQIDFLESYTVIVKSLNVQTKVHQLQHEDAEEGTSVTLNCSVHTGSCGGKPRVHWFKQSEESSPGVLYSHGGGDNDRCEETMDRPTNSCVYSLPIHNVSSEQTGTYYCAVAACGQVLFGNGTKIKIKIKDVGLAVYLLSGALAFSSIVVVVLAISLCKMKKRYSSLCTGNKQSDSVTDRSSHCSSHCFNGFMFSGRDVQLDILVFVMAKCVALSKGTRHSDKIDNQSHSM